MAETSRKFSGPHSSDRRPDFIATEAERTPAPLRDTMLIATDAPSMSHFALEIAPAAAIGNIETPDGMIALLARRLNDLWPELARTLAG